MAGAVHGALLQAGPWFPGPLGLQCLLETHLGFGSRPSPLIQFPPRSRGLQKRSDLPVSIRSTGWDLDGPCSGFGFRGRFCSAPGLEDPAQMLAGTLGALQEHIWMLQGWGQLKTPSNSLQLDDSGAEGSALWVDDSKHGISADGYP